jgi:hypothetical protein
MKPIVFFQCGETQSTPWLDAIQTWNSDSDIKGFWINPKHPQSYLYHFEKKENKIVFNKNVGYVEGSDFVITKQFVQPGMDMNRSVTKGINIDFIIEWLNANDGKALGFGTFLSSGSHVDIIQNSVYYTRDPWMGGHILDIEKNEFISSDDNNKLSTVTWFYAYKVKNLPIYLLVFNPSTTTMGDNVEFETETNRYRIMDPHMGYMSTQFLKPKMSKNAYPLEDKWYVVKGEEFSFEVGALSTIKLGLGEIIDPSLIKVLSDLNLEHLGDNKYKARFKNGQQSAYISIRMNTGNTMDWTFINSGNRLVYNIKISKHYEEV